MDICGTPERPLIFRDSNPGHVSTTPGGVGRNIAQNLSMLGVDVRMLTVLGGDAYAAQIEKSCTDAGIDMSLALHVPGVPSSIYLYITDENSDMALGISDMSICEYLTPEYLQRNKRLLDESAVIVADTNLPAETVRWLAHECRPPLIVDPVSANKAKRLVGSLGGIDTLKPNRVEAEMLTGIRIETQKDARRAIRELLNAGVRRVFLTLGSEGVLCTDGSETLFLPCCPGRIVSTTGCGDSFTAAVTEARLDGCSLRRSAQMGLAAGALTAAGSLTVSTEMSLERLNTIIKENFE